MKKVTAIIEARCNSKRLPNKVLLKILNKPTLLHLIERLKRSKKIENIVVATSTNKKDKKIINLCKKNNLDFYRGSELNVMKRVYLTAKKFNADPIVQITGDCPLIDPKIVDKVINKFLKNKLDFCSNALIRSYPDGMDVCVFSFKTFKKVQKLSGTNKKYHEHTALYYLKNKNKFKHMNILAPKRLKYPKMGLTLDEYLDFKLIKKIFEYFYKRNNYNFSCENIVNLMLKNKSFFNINKKVKRKGIPKI